MAAIGDATLTEASRPRLPGFPDLDLDELQAMFAQVGDTVDEEASDAELISRLTALAALRNSLDAATVATELAFARAHGARQCATGDVDPRTLERSIGTQIGLANHVSPFVGRNRMHVARDLHDGLDHVRALHAAGGLDQQRVSTIARAAAHLDRAEREELDRRLTDHDLATLGVGRLRDLVTRLAAEIAPGKFRARTAAARDARHVTISQAPDGMATLRAHLPVEQGVACYAALCGAWTEAQVDPAPLTRSRAQVLADTLVERVTGKATAEHVDLEVQVTVPIEALLDEDSPLPAEIPGFGPVPVEFLARARGRKLLRRLVTRAGIVIGGDSRSRCFPRGLADLIRARDRGRCTAPYCNAMARQTDHTVRNADGGPTTFTNGAAMCVLHNQLREQPGWWVEPTPDGGTRTTTPTGHTYDVAPTRISQGRRNDVPGERDEPRRDR